MFEKKNLVFYYCTTPLHMGAGTAVGAIDNPIQREVHSNHPVINGAGIKGAVRHHLTHVWGGEKQKTIDELFGSDTSAKELHAGAVSFTDAHLVAFPVRSLKNTYAYVTCPYALARLERLAANAGAKVAWQVPAVQQGQALVATDSQILQGKVYLESYEFSKAATGPDIKPIAEWLAKTCLPDSTHFEYFQKKLREDLVVLNNTDFDYFVRHCTAVEPHVKIDDTTGTAANGALFYTENLPPESILAGLTLASIERTKGKESNTRRKAAEALTAIFQGEGDLAGIGGTLVQMGGDATTGRGLVLVTAVTAGNGKEN
ncbi:MAG TPA: type III-B CRISPR module RAMP protein Cmr4 [Candidatus Ozemobacteraceae bacterium]|nr:type III-B CRISPR module RAMP protein Cmr4 [Candidatus Ozemobacteraceae bacterium]HQG29414.1 type III-B CRISPR module RAMP protein Cmr4 [Candidatus Ozemobacteraceae bacterium]